jgi:hypothetical protein
VGLSPPGKTGPVRGTAGLHGASERYAGETVANDLCFGTLGTPSVVRRRLSKRHRPFRYLAPIKFLYLRYLRHCALHLAPRFRSERPRGGSGRFFSECPRLLNHLHRRALDRRAGLSILVGTINVLLHFFSRYRTCAAPSRTYQSRCIRLVKYAGETVLYFLSRGRICALQHAGPPCSDLKGP